MSINIEAFRKGKDYICVHNKVYTMEEYIERVDILEAKVEELKAKNGRLRTRIKELERKIAKVTPPNFDYKDLMEASPDGNLLCYLLIMAVLLGKKIGMEVKAMRKKDVKKFWEAQRAKEEEQLKPFAEKIVKAVLKCSEVIKQENKKESVNNELDKLRSNFYFQLNLKGRE